jgi:DNA-binding CsgD family transcriptional regulator
MQTATEAHQQVIEIWSKYYPNAPKPDKLEEFLAQLPILNQAHKTNLRTVIFGYHDFSIYHINTGTARYFGSTPEEITRAGASFIIRCINKNQVESAINNTKIVTRELYSTTPEEKQLYQSTYVNCNITCPLGNKHRSLFHAFPVMFDDLGNPLIGMFLIYDLEPFMTSGVWWYRYKVGEKVFLFHSDTMTLNEMDLLTTRELEILTLIADGASSKDIAAKLFLSVNTVDNHRRNMLKKSGAVDTSSLIHLCKLCQII